MHAKVNRFVKFLFHKNDVDEFVDNVCVEKVAKNCYTLCEYSFLFHFIHACVSLRVSRRLMRNVSVNSFAPRGKFLLRGLFILVLSLLFIRAPDAFAGLGFSPGLTRVEGMQPNTSVNREIVFSRDEVRDPLTLDITLTGMGAEYMSGPDQVTFASGQDRAVFPLVITATDLPSGTYEATVNAITHEDAQGGTAKAEAFSASSRVVLAAFAGVSFTVTNEVKEEYSIKEIVLRPSEEQQRLGFSLQLVNTGNVAARPAKIDVVITNQDDPTFIYEETILGDTLPLVKAFATEDVGVFTNAQLPAGKYWVDFLVYNTEGNVIYEAKKSALQIFPPGTLQQQGMLRSFEMDKEKYEENELIQFRSDFQNTGDIGLSASLIVDLVRDGKRVDSLKTDPVFVPAGKIASFVLDQRLAEAGEYTATGYVSYGIFKTDGQMKMFRVGGLDIRIVYAGIGGFVLLLIGIVLMVKKKKRGAASTPPPSVPPAAPPSVPPSQSNPHL